jgi:ATP-dependent Clp protease ATP-binding subunit ClpC
MQKKTKTLPTNNFNSFGEDDEIKPNQPPSDKIGKSTSKTPALDTYCRDLTGLASDGKMEQVVGREAEIMRVSQILLRKKKNNPVLIGEPGCGKTAIVEGLALMIYERKVSRYLLDKRIFSLDLSMVIAGTKYRGQFEERMKAIMQELTTNPNIILFIDEIHTLVGAGGSTGSMDASNILKPALARGEIKVIGATTLDEYSKNIEKDGALERRFQKVIVKQPSVSEAITVLTNVKSSYEKHHNVRYTNESIVACVQLSSRYITDRQLPDKAFDVMDEAGSRMNTTKQVVPKQILVLEEKLNQIIDEKRIVVDKQQYEKAANLRDQEKQIKTNLQEAQAEWDSFIRENPPEVTEEHIREVISSMTNIPVSKLASGEKQKVIDLAESLSKNVIGQQPAVDTITRAIQRSRIGLKNKNKPTGVFLFLGQTGVGKTELCKELARQMFDTEDSLIRIDMSEYMEKINATRLIGAPPGYVGYEEGGELTEKVRRNPYSVILFDEIEKAHKDVFNLLLQVFDDGHLTDSQGRKVDFRNTIMIMTSNIGSAKLRDTGVKGIGFQTQKTQTENTQYLVDELIKNELKKAFTPEFLNRIDEVVVFNALTQPDIARIARLQLTKIEKTLAEMGFGLEITEAMIEAVSTKGYDSQYGARPLNRTIVRLVEDPLSELILREDPQPKSTLVVDFDKETDKVVTSIVALVVVEAIVVEKVEEVIETTIESNIDVPSEITEVKSVKPKRKPRVPPKGSVE